MESIESGICKQNQEQCSKPGDAWTDSPLILDVQVGNWSAIMDGNLFSSQLKLASYTHWLQSSKIQIIASPPRGFTASMHLQILQNSFSLAKSHVTKTSDKRGNGDNFGHIQVVYCWFRVAI